MLTQRSCALEPRVSSQTGLTRLSEKIDSDNDAAPARPFPRNFTFHVCNPKHLDTSVSV